MFLCADAWREGHEDLAGQFRTRALGTATVTGAVGLGGVFVLRADAPQLFDGLTGRGLPVVAVSVAAGLATMVLLEVRRHVLAPIASALAVTTILIRWAVAQYPYVLLPGLTIEQAGRGRATLVAMLVALVVGSLILVPALVYLYAVFQRREPRPEPARAPGTVDEAGATGTHGPA